MNGTVTGRRRCRKYGRAGCHQKPDKSSPQQRNQASLIAEKALKMRQHKCIYTRMPEHLITTKITPSALRLLRIIAASTGEKQYEVMDRLLADEAKRLSLGGRR
jgi:hypothetical protein